MIYVFIYQYTDNITYNNLCITFCSKLKSYSSNEMNIIESRYIAHVKKTSTLYSIIGLNKVDWKI